MNSKTKMIALLVAGLGTVFAPACSDDDDNNPNNIVIPPNNNNPTNNGTNNPTNNGTNNPTNNGTNNPTNNGTNNPTNNGTNNPTNNNNVDPDPTCENYCTTIMANCTGENAQYGTNAECVDHCNNVGAWNEGMRGDMSGNTVACRIYHGNAPAAADPGLHCDHAGPSGGDVCGSWCDVYCAQALNNCTGDNELYANEQDCATNCAAFPATGNANDLEYDTVQCRIYHSGAPAAAAPATHCPHSGEVPTDFCVDSPETFRFKTNPVADYMKVDRMGMPAISTAVISAGMKNDYNDATPADDANGDFVDDITARVTALHAALDDDLAGVPLTPCAPAACVGQAAPLVVPDTLKIDTTTAPGFPNGRMLPDPVMDVTLAVVLLDLTVTGQTVTTLVGVLNPTENDLGVEGAFLSAFPYLHPPHAP